MNKWRKRAGRYKKSWHYYIELLKASESNERALRVERDAALNKVEELRHDAVRLATELARVQGECDKWQRAAENCDRDYTTQMYRDNALLAWQRGVREAWNAYDAEFEVEASTLDALRQAIEAEPTFDFTAYMRRAEYWGQTYDDTAEPKEET